MPRNDERALRGRERRERLPGSRIPVDVPLNPENVACSGLDLSIDHFGYVEPLRFESSNEGGRCRWLPALHEAEATAHYSGRLHSTLPWAEIRVVTRRGTSGGSSPSVIASSSTAIPFLIPASSRA